jgi:Mrp family chromosome partitioning ATPase
MLADTDRARDALQSIPPDLPRDEWVRAGMAFHAAGGDLDTFDQWSAQAGNYSERDARDTWRSFKPGKGLGAGTLYRMAAELGGWRMGGEPHQSKAPAKPHARPIEAPAKPRPGMAPADVWARCEAATDSHPYIMQKQGTPEGLRVVPAGDALRVAGESMAGALVVPVLRQDGTVSTLQLIAPPETAARLKAAGRPAKLNLPGYPVEGSFTVGELVPGGVVFVCEGIGQAWAAWKATGRAAVVCFGWGRVRAVAAELRQRDKSARLVLVPDVGKEQDAEKIAREVGAAVASMPEGWPNNSDVNDLAQRDGFDVLEILLSNASDAHEAAPKVHPLARFVDFDGSAAPPRWVLPGFIGHGVLVVAGAHGVGKTTALLPLALTAAGLHGDDLRERLHIVDAVRLDPSFVAQVGTTYREQFTRTVDGVELLPLVVLDTKSAVLALDNENDNSEASAMMAALKQGFAGLPVWLIGHVAKANLSRSDVTGLSSRGASAIEGMQTRPCFWCVKATRAIWCWARPVSSPDGLSLKSPAISPMRHLQDEFGNVEIVVMRWGTAAPAEMSRKEAAEQATERQRKEDEASLPRHSRRCRDRVAGRESR